MVPNHDKTFLKFVWLQHFDIYIYRISIQEPRPLRFNLRMFTLSGEAIVDQVQKVALYLVEPVAKSNI